MIQQLHKESVTEVVLGPMPNEDSMVKFMSKILGLAPKRMRGSIFGGKFRMNAQKFVSVVIACFNEEGNLLPIHERLTKTFEGINYNYEILFVENGSTGHF